MAPRYVLLTLAITTCLLLAAATCGLTNEDTRLHATVREVALATDDPREVMNPLDCLPTEDAKFPSTNQVPTAGNNESLGKPMVGFTVAEHDERVRIFDVAWILANVPVYRSVEPRLSGQPELPDDIEEVGIDMQDLIQVVQESVAPDQWMWHGNTVTGFGTSLVVRAPVETQVRIAELLADLSR
ncbi:MAG: hypothetical protein IPP14_05595 [Planctomycetes bacterium]|nr:hypothetical protein [Planctomycetota bacterium]